MIQLILNRYRHDLYDDIHSVIVQWKNEKVLLNIFSNSVVSSSENRDIILNRIVPPKDSIENIFPVRRFNNVLKLFRVTAFVIMFIGKDDEQAHTILWTT